MLLRKTNKTAIPCFRVEIYFRKPGVLKTGLDKVPRLDDYSSDTQMQSISCEAGETLEENVLTRFPGAAYVHILELEIL